MSENRYNKYFCRFYNFFASELNIYIQIFTKSTSTSFSQNRFLGYFQAISKNVQLFKKSVYIQDCQGKNLSTHLQLFFPIYGGLRTKASPPLICRRPHKSEDCLIQIQFQYSLPACVVVWVMTQLFGDTQVIQS